MAFPVDFDEQRGPTEFASAGDNRGSNRPTVVTAYRKDLKGCGVKDFIYLGDQVTVVEYVDCVQRLLYTMSFSGTIHESDVSKEWQQYYDNDLRDRLDAAFQAQI